uniref:DUF834 domain-containing protein n=1 Tax=Oryza sativa subsp. japonica TaxID=39947 RepID=Q75H17_ORYSJ|nr:hypothetical protein [Oryza sativa Japonica Group]
MMTSLPTAARHLMLAGERRRGGANGQHLRVEGDAANSPRALTMTDDNRQRRRRGRGGEDVRVDGDGGAPVTFGGNGGRDEDGYDLANPMATFPSDDDDKSGGAARLHLRRRRRRTG